MKKSFLKELLDRRIPQILGSYFVGATTLIFFIDWLVAKYGFSDYYTSLALFGLISILPSVIILAYFHGAPGKDEWTKLEKFGIPVNILFIAIALFAGYKFNLWQEEAPDHSKIYDAFLIHIESNEEEVNNLKTTTQYINEADSYIDSLYHLNDRKLQEIREYVNVELKKEFMHHDLDIYYSETKEEDEMLNKSVSSNYLWELFSKNSRTDIYNQYDSTLSFIGDNLENSFEYFSENNNKHIDILINVSIYEANPLNKTKMMMMDLGDDYTLYVVETAAYKFSIEDGGDLGLTYHINTGIEFLLSNDEDETLEDVVLNMLINKLSGYSFGRNIGMVNNILDSNLVTIKLNNLDVMRGSNLICRGRGYTSHEDNLQIARESINNYINDGMIIYDYFVKNPDKVDLLNDKLDFDIPPGVLVDYTDDLKEQLDSMKLKIDKTIDNLRGSSHIDHEQFTYYLKILNIQDSIATAKITGSVFPFAYPQVGDEINIK